MYKISIGNLNFIKESNISKLNNLLSDIDKSSNGWIENVHNTDTFTTEFDDSINKKTDMIINNILMTKRMLLFKLTELFNSYGNNIITCNMPITKHKGVAYPIDLELTFMEIKTLIDEGKQIILYSDSQNEANPFEVKFRCAIIKN